VVIRPLVSLALASLFVVSCADSDEVNSAFAQNRVSWFVFDTEQGTGVRALEGFEQSQKVAWQPRDRGVYATDVAPAPGWPGAVAVAGLGLLLVDDTNGVLKVERPGAQVPLSSYRTDKLFTWQGKLFVTLSQKGGAEAPPASLAWWAPGQSRLAFYPIPSQVKDPSRQAVAVQVPTEGDALLRFEWKRRVGQAWVFESGAIDLATGQEQDGAISLMAATVGPEFDAVRTRLAERLGAGVPTRALRGPGLVALFTETGWIAVAKAGDSRARLYRLPDLGTAGRYSGALGLVRGILFTWETSFRGYSGAAGLVHVPFGVVAP